MNDCKHRVVEWYSDKGFVVNTMSDFIPIKYCPECGISVNEIPIEDVKI